MPKLMSLPPVCLPAHQTARGRRIFSCLRRLVFRVVALPRLAAYGNEAKGESAQVTFAGKSMVNLTKIGPDRGSVRSLPVMAFGLCGLLAVAACTTTPAPDGIYDPHEAQNRDFHEFNVELDRLLLKPAGTAYVSTVPQPVAIAVSNFSSNMNLPGTVLNDLFQLKLAEAAQNTGRFVLNSTVGVLGIFDPATEIGLLEYPTDFGETLHLLGVPEGAYIEMPVLGPTTDRDLLGMTVDFLLDPLRLFVPDPLRYLSYGAAVGATVGDRGRYSATVDSILYDSADGYAQARLLYLENRRYQLGQPATTDTFEDPYAQ